MNEALWLAYIAKWTSCCLSCKYKWLNIIRLMDMDKEGLTARDHKPLFIILHCIVLWWVAVVDYLSLHQLLHCGTTLILTWGAVHCIELRWMIYISVTQLRCSEVYEWSLTHSVILVRSHLFNIDLMSYQHWCRKYNHWKIDVLTHTKKMKKKIKFRHYFVQRQML